MVENKEKIGSRSLDGKKYWIKLCLITDTNYKLLIVNAIWNILVLCQCDRRTRRRPKNDCKLEC